MLFKFSDTLYKFDGLMRHPVQCIVSTAKRLLTQKKTSSNKPAAIVTIMDLNKQKKKRNQLIFYVPMEMYWKCTANIK